MNIHSLLPYAPFAIRIGLTVLHHYYHTACHKGLHHVTHHIPWLNHITHKCPWMLDAAMIAALLVFGQITEGGEHEQHASE